METSFWSRLAITGQRGHQLKVSEVQEYHASSYLPRIEFPSTNLNTPDTHYVKT
jgi:hypothetical protein